VLESVTTLHDLPPASLDLLPLHSAPLPALFPPLSPTPSRDDLDHHLRLWPHSTSYRSCQCSRRLASTRTNFPILRPRLPPEEERELSWIEISVPVEVWERIRLNLVAKEMEDAVDQIARAALQPETCVNADCDEKPLKQRYEWELFLKRDLVCGYCDERRFVWVDKLCDGKHEYHEVSLYLLISVPEQYLDI